LWGEIERYRLFIYDGTQQSPGWELKLWGESVRLGLELETLRPIKGQFYRGPPYMNQSMKVRWSI